MPPWGSLTRYVSKRRLASSAVLLILGLTLVIADHTGLSFLTMVEAGSGWLPDEFFNLCGFAGDGRLYVGYNLGMWPVVRPFHPRTGLPYETIRNVSVPGLLSSCTASKDGALKVLVYHDNEYDYYGNGSYARWGVLYFNLSTWRLLAAYPIHANTIIWREDLCQPRFNTL